MGDARRTRAVEGQPIRGVREARTPRIVGADALEAGTAAGGDPDVATRRHLPLSGVLHLCQKLYCQKFYASRRLYRRIASSTTAALTAPWRVKASRVATAIDWASTWKWRRSATRVSERPYPSVPREE